MHKNRLPLPTGRIAILGAIILMHIGFVFALQSGLQQQPAPPAGVPKEIFVSLITPEQPKPVEVPKPPRPEPKPEVKPKVKKAVKPPPPPPVKKQPSEQAITAPPEPPAPPATPEPVEEVAATAPAEAAPPAAPPVPAGPARPKLISSGIEYVRPPQPEYPAFSRRMREEGKVVMRVLVNEKGRPEQVEIQSSSGFARLDDAARKAALRAVFKPHIENGRAVAVFAIIPIKFQLDS